MSPTPPARRPWPRPDTESSFQSSSSSSPGSSASPSANAFSSVAARRDPAPRTNPKAHMTTRLPQSSPRQQEQQEEQEQQHTSRRPRSVILDRQNQNYRFNLRPTSVARFPQSSTVTDATDEPQPPPPHHPSDARGSPNMRKAVKATEKSGLARLRTLPTSPPTGTDKAKSKELDNPVLSEAAARGRRRLSSRIVTDIDSPSPSEASSRAPSRAPSRSATINIITASAPSEAPSDKGPNDKAQADTTAEVHAPSQPASAVPARTDTLRVPRLPASQQQSVSRPNSKVLTSFPFPHPSTPSGSKHLSVSSRHDRTSIFGDPFCSNAGSINGGGGGRGFRWSPTRIITVPLRYVGRCIDRATNVFAGPYERRLMREEAEDDELTRQIVERLERGESDIPGSRRESLAGDSEPLLPPSRQGNARHKGAVQSGGAGSSGGGKYGSLSTQPHASRTSYLSTMSSNTSSSSLSETDPSDPYGYRRLAGPVLLPAYNADLATRRRERRRARSRARFQCMAFWTIYTVSVVLVILVVGCAVSMWQDWRDGQQKGEVGWWILFQSN